MNLSRRKKYLAVIGFCGVALLVDRFAIPRPASAEAALEVLAVRPRIPVAPEAKPVNGVLPVPEIPFPKNIRTLGTGGLSRDIFALRTSPGTSTSESSRMRSTEKGSPEMAAITADFESKHKLTGIMFDDHTKIAVLGDQWVEIGHEIDGCFLKKLEVDTAVFACPGKDVTLGLHKQR